jgi:triosephosphate isomerase
MPFPKPVVLGNWKMNGLRADGVERVEILREHIRQAPGQGTLGVCPPATLLTVVEEVLKNGEILLGGQDCSSERQGAFTGDLSAEMLADAGCRLVIVGHSERRHGHGETDELVRAKAEAALGAGLIPVLCIGETEAEWEEGETIQVLDGQLDGSLPEHVTPDNLIVAYEPVWAIGTGRTPSTVDIARTHAHLRARLRALVTDGDQVRLLYGGSVKADNAREIMGVPDVDGVLVGGASLDAAQFWAIYTAGQAATP